jgi:spermidine synthase
MHRSVYRGLGFWVLVLSGVVAAQAQDVVFETTTAYHHIRVLDQYGVRILSFDGTTETRMSLRDPLSGHFEYTQFFHMPWLWNTQMETVLMVGLGGASTQRAFEYYYTNLMVETVEIDPVVLHVAQEFFYFKPSPRQRVHLEDGRVFLRRAQNQYDAIVMDAYTENRYGSFLPQHLVTKEFFELASAHLTTNGVLAYNVIGNLRGWRTDLLGAMYKTLKKVFPQVYMFLAGETNNVVMIATKSSLRTDLNTLQQRAAVLIRQRRVTLPTFRARLSAFRADAPLAAARAPILTDDFAPVEGLLGIGDQ